MELSVVLPAYNEGENISSLIKKIRGVLNQSGLRYEIIVADGGSKDETRKLAEEAGAQKIFIQKSPGYGGALKEAFRIAQGQYILTLDSDLSHEPYYILAMLEKIRTSGIVIASRYVPGGAADMPLLRKILSIILNRVYTLILSLPLKDISSGFRLYRRNVLERMDITSRDFDVLEEIIIKAYNDGWKISEVPFVYKPRKGGKSHAKLVQFGIAFAKTLLRMRRLRNSVRAADYSQRAFRSVNPLLRHWQRKRFYLILNLTEKEDRILYVGCGSSPVIQGIPQAVGIDSRPEKLRYLRQTHTILVNGSAEQLPFAADSFDCVIFSEAAENASSLDQALAEVRSVLKDEGTLILAVPERDRILWKLIEASYYGAGTNHLPLPAKDCTARELEKKLESLKFTLLRRDFVCGAEVILKARKEVAQ